MSIGIGAVLNDGVLLVADSRDQVIGESGLSTRVNDTLDKIRPVNKSIFAIILGVTKPAVNAVNSLREALPDGCEPKFIASELRECVRVAWRAFVRSLDPSVDLDQEGMALALLLGGITNGSPFVAQSAISNQHQRNLLSVKASTHIVTGGENQGSGIFEQRAVERLKGVPWIPSEGPLNDWTRGVLQAAVDTIEAVISQTIFTGGAIRYAVVRKRFPILKDVWNE